MGPTLALFFLFLMPLGCSSQACVVRNNPAEIVEHSPVGTVVTQIELGVGYTVEVEPLDTFIMNGSSLLIDRDVDYEKEEVLSAILTCKKDGIFEDLNTLIVNVININDNEPFFKQAVYRFSISESLPVNSAIGNAIEAEDADQEVLYYMLSGNANAVTYFRLSSETNPIILVNTRLDFDDFPTVNLNLTARDTSNPGVHPSHTATASIVIDITDADDKPPFFQPCRVISRICISDGYTGSVNRTEQVNGPLILMPGPLYAVDGDRAIGASVGYTIISGNNDNVFNVDTTSGNITMNKAVDKLGFIFLQVMAFQNDDPTKYSTTSVVIDVKEKNSFPPTFEKPIYYGIIPLDPAIGTFVLDSNEQNRPLVVFAADEDFPDKKNPSLVYKIENSSAFRILQEGFIMTDVAITVPGIVELQVSATDSSNNEVASALVSVEVIAATTTVPTTSTTTKKPESTTRSPAASVTGTTTPTSPGTGTTTATTKGTSTTTTSISGTGTTATPTKITGTTKPPSTGTGTTTTTTQGTGTTKPSSPGTGTPTTTTKGTGTTKPPSPGTGTTTTTTMGTGTTKPLSPGTGTTTTTTKITGTTKPSSSGTGTTTTTTKGTGTTKPPSPGTGTTTTTTKGTGTTKPPGTGTSTTNTTTIGIGTTTSKIPATGTTTTTTKGTVTTTISVPETGTTTTMSKGTSTTTTRTPDTGTSTTTPSGTGATKSTDTSTGTTTSTTQNIQTGSTTTSKSVTPGVTTTGASNTVADPKENSNVYTATDMAAVGASLGAILALSLIILGFLLHKHYGNTIKRRLWRNSGDNFGDSTDRTEQLKNEADDSNNDNSNFGGFSTTEAESSKVTLDTAAGLGSSPIQSTPSDNQPSLSEEQDDDSDDKKVKSILTKELKEDVGYKAVWFREDAVPEVVVIDGVEDGEADDDDSEGDFSNRQEDNDDEEEEDDEDLNPTFNAADNMSENSIL